MEAFDRETAARVWQRVQSRGPVQPPDALPPTEDPAELVLQAHDLAGLYLGLRKQLPGWAAERIGNLYRSQKKTVDCLRGLCAMTGGAPGLPPMMPWRGTARERLRSCAHRERRLAEAMARQASQGEFAAVWGQLSRQAGERCRVVLEILGELER